MKIFAVKNINLLLSRYRLFQDLPREVNVLEQMQ